MKRISEFRNALLCVLTVVCLSLCAAACAWGETTPGGGTDRTPVAIAVEYDAASGVASWEAVPGAAKYTVTRVRGQNAPETEETTTNSIQLYLKAGVTLVTVNALDDKGVELGAGGVTLTLETDFGAPAAPAGLAYDAGAGIFSWTVDGAAVKYVVTAAGVTNDFSAEREVTEPSCALNLGKGIYTLSVLGVSAAGAEGPESGMEYRSYTDEAFDTETDGFYKLFDFQDPDVLDISRPSEYCEWGTALGEANVSVVSAHAGELPVDFPSAALCVDQPESEVAQFAGVTFLLPKEVAGVGTLYFDVFRASGSSVGVMLDDGEGHAVPLAVAWDHTASFNQWATVAVTFDAILDKEPEFSAVRQMTFYTRATKGGRYYFDNVYYDKTNVGLIGGLSYVKADKTLVWDEVESARSYEIKIGADEPLVCDGPSLVLENGLPEGENTVALAAVNGDSRREKSFTVTVAADAKFDVPVAEGGEEKIIADFATTEYLAYIEPVNLTDKPAGWSVADGALTVQYAKGWKNGGLTYAFPHGIPVERIFKLTVRFQGMAVLYALDSAGKDCYINCTAAADYLSVTDGADGWKTAVVDFSKIPAGQDNNWTDGVCDALTALVLTTNAAGTVKYGPITYAITDPAAVPRKEIPEGAALVTGFNNDGYALSGYAAYVSVVAAGEAEGASGEFLSKYMSAKYTWSQGAAVFTFDTPIATADLSGIYIRAWLERGTANAIADFIFTDAAGKTAQARLNSTGWQTVSIAKADLKDSEGTALGDIVSMKLYTSQAGGSYLYLDSLYTRKE